MANTPYSTRGYTSGSTAVTMVAGETSKNKLIRNIEIFNGDSISQTAVINTISGSETYTHAKSSMPPDSTWVWEVGTTISGSSESLQTVLTTSACTVNCTYHCLYAEIA